MNLKNQVLSIKQAQELQESGFDVEKYASMEYAPIYNNEFEIVNHYLRVRGTGGCTLIIYPRKEEDVYVPTLSIGDIMECLPKNIKFEGLEYDVSIYRNQISYYDRNIDEDIFVSKAGLSLIDALFECLVWCIKQKHIEL